jgi:GNAT superfamily N-acetyltransferase
MTNAVADSTDSTSISIGVLADHPHLISQVGEIRCAEWGKPPEPVELDYWVDVTRREAGHDEIPVTWVAIDGQGRAVGAVGILEFDPDEFRDRSPWLVGMVVAPDWRARGIGSRLVRELEGWAAQQGFPRVWVATGPAERFYQKCGWSTVDRFVNDLDEAAVILERRLDA